MTSHETPLDPALLAILRCPACRGLFADPGAPPPRTLDCTGCGRSYPVRSGVPVLLVDEARGGPGPDPVGDSAPVAAG